MVTLDSREVAPLASTVNMSTDGILSVAVPGNILGLYEAWKRFGKLPWRVLLEPVISLSRDGFQVGKALGDAINKEQNKIKTDPYLR